MVNEVNKLIFNTLVEGGAVYIADRGTLSVERTPSRAMRRGRVVSPSYQLTFTTECRAESLASIIASFSGVSAEDGEDIARRWLDKVTKDDRVVIEGVGTIQNGSFTADKSLAEALALSSKTLTLTRTKSSRRWPWVVLVLALILGLVAAAYVLYGDKLISRDIVTKTPEIEAVKADVTTEQSASADTTAVAISEVQTTEPAPQTEAILEVVTEAEVADAPKVEAEVTQTLVDQSDWRTQPVHHYVIFGSYSNTTNANNAVRKIMRRNPEAQCKVIRLGGMHAVAVFGSYSRAECDQFKRQYRALYKDAWVHTPKRYK
ncbi:MAG: SPOR domain-containing protein [Alistipes sp.]|nr:SPOR domain-containing protein [Alistipes sp.]